MKSYEERALQLGFSLSDIETACCNLVESVEGLNPRQTLKEYTKHLNPDTFSLIEENIARNPSPEWEEPIWKVKLPHFLNFCEMQKELNSLQSKTGV